MSKAVRFSSISIISRPWRASAAWLNRAPVEDPVDRRNAPMLQVVLILLGFAPPLLWLYRILLSGLPWRPSETASLAMSLALSAIAIASLLLVRRGRFKWAAGQLLAVAALLMMLDYARVGFTAQAYEQPVQVIWIVIAGLVLGRLALWLMYGCHVLAFAVGLVRDLSLHPGDGFDAWNNQLVSALITAVIFLLIAIVVDRSVAALRESLREATLRGDELARANVRLEAEIDERERMKDQLVHAQKVEAVGRLASGVAHDFNHLIGLMLGYAQIGQRSGDAAELKHALAGIEIAAQRATTIAGTLLNFARREATRFEVFDAGEALREIKPMLMQLFDSGVKLDIRTPKAPAPISFDRAQFALVVLNIAANANQAMPRGGLFRVTARSSEDAGVELELADTGHGMSLDVQQRIFEPFFTTKPRGQGTGLGLAVAVNLVNGAGGEITVKSEPERGSTFSVRFPHPAVASSSPAPGPRERVAPIAS
jgi:signal transduction histidine kinase